LSGNGNVQSVLLEDGRFFPADIVVLSAGVRSTTTLAVQAGLKVNLGIVVDDEMHTSQPDIFAAGDATEHSGVLYGTWAPALAQGITAGSVAAGHSVVFRPLPRSNTLKVLGIDLFSVGKITPLADDLLIEKTAQNLYHGFIFHESKLVGAILLGDSTAATATKLAVENQLDCSALLLNHPNTDQILDFLKSAQGL